MPIFKFSFMEFEGDGNRSFLLIGAVTSDARVESTYKKNFRGIAMSRTDPCDSRLNSGG